MPKTKNKRLVYDQQHYETNRTSHKEKENEIHLEIEHTHTKNDCVLRWPSHMLVFGSTMSGKTSLISDILDNIELVYQFSTPRLKGKLIVVSPIHTLEIAAKMSSVSCWDIELYNVIELNREFEEHLIERFRLVPENMVKVLLLDDILTQSSHNQIILLNKLFAYFRHEGVSIIATVHSYDIKFSTIIDQAGLIVSMYCLNISTVVRSILRRCLYKGTAKVWKELRRIFFTKLQKHDYICLNFSKESLSSEVYFVTNNLFYPKTGINLSQIIGKM